VRIKFDKESGAFYLTIREGEYSETLDLVDPGFGAYMDVDAEGNVLGVEFLSFEEFAEITENGLEIPDRVEDVEAFVKERKDHGRALAELEEKERRDMVQAALDALLPPERDVVELYFFQGLKAPEIAKMRGVPLGLVRANLRSAVQNLRTTLRPESGDEENEAEIKEDLLLIAS
jgi:RNA polymerase sigma factor (sigma-70 family)